MDPVSITATAFTAASTAYKISTCLYGFIQSAKTVDETLNMLYDTVKSLDSSLKSVDSTLKIAVVQRAITSHEVHRETLASITRSVQDCDHTLKALDARLNDVGQSRTSLNFFRKSILQVKLNMSQSGIINLRSHIQSHSISLQVAIDTLTLAVTCQSSEAVSQDLPEKIDQLTDMIMKLRVPKTKEINQRLPPDFKDLAVSQHIQSLIENAEAVISSASTVFDRNSSYGSEATIRDERRNDSQAGSEFGVPLRGTVRTRIRHWIPGISDDVTPSSVTEPDSNPLSSLDSGSLDLQRPIKVSEHEVCDDLQSLDLDDPSSSEDDEYEVNAIQILFQNGSVHMLEHRFGDAETFLHRGLKKAETMSSKAQFGLHLQEQRLRLALARLYQAKFEEAIPALKSLAQIKSSGEQDTCRALQALHGLAQAYCCAYDYVAAEKACKKAIKGWNKLYGKQHQLYNRSLSLLASIYDMSGDHIMATAYTECLSTPEPELEGNLSPLDKVEGPSIQQIRNLIEQPNQPPQQIQNLIEQPRRSPQHIQKPIEQPKQSPQQIQNLIEQPKLSPPQSVSSPARDAATAEIATRRLNFLIRSLPVSKNNAAKDPMIEAELKSCIADGASVAYQSGYDATPIVQAVWKGQSNVVSLLLDAGADVNMTYSRTLSNGDKTKMPVLSEAIRRVDQAMVAILLSNGADVSLRDSYQGWTPLHYAAMLSDTEITKLLLASGADANAPVHPSNERTRALVGYTPLHCAITWGKIDRARMLLSQGASSDVTVDNGETTLVIAIWAGRYRKYPSEMLSLLLKSGFDPTAPVALEQEIFMPEPFNKELPAVQLDYPVQFSSHIEFARTIGAKKSVISLLQKHVRGA